MAMHVPILIEAGSCHRWKAHPLSIRAVPSTSTEVPLVRTDPAPRTLSGWQATVGSGGSN